MPKEYDHICHLRFIRRKTQQVQVRLASPNLPFICDLTARATGNGWSTPVDTYMWSSFPCILTQNLLHHGLEPGRVTNILSMAYNSFGSGAPAVVISINFFFLFFLSRYKFKSLIGGGGVCRLITGECSQEREEPQ